MKKTFFYLAFLSALIFSSANAQEDQEAIQDNSINTQFNELIESSNNYQDYKVVKQNRLSQLQSNTVKEINELNAEIEKANETIEEQQEQIAQLKENLQNTNANLESITQEKDEISFFGMPVQKETYQTIMWVIIFLLILVLVFFIYKYNNSNALTKEARKNLKENEEEFEEYRKKSLEKQQKLGRQLQDERNKHVKGKS